MGCRGELVSIDIAVSVDVPMNVAGEALLEDGFVIVEGLPRWGWR